MSNLIEAAPEDSGGGGGPNRVFILIALGLAGLLVLGLLLVFGYVAGTRFGLFGSRNGNGAATATAQAAAVATPVVTRAPTATTPPTAAPVTATPTRVVGAPSPAPTTVALAQPTATVAPGSGDGGVAATATPEGGAGQLPTTGAELDILIMAALMALLLVIARGFRMALRS